MEIVIISILSLFSGIAVFDCVAQVFPLAPGFIVWFSQKVFAFVCGLGAFGLSFIILAVGCEVFLEVVKKLVIKKGVKKLGER